MDHDRFDSIARRVFAGSRRSRRAALAALLGAALLPASPAIVLGDANSKKKRKAGLSAQAADRCYRGTRCTSGPGAYASRCDFSFLTVFRNTDSRGANLSKSSFRGADLTGADFRGANLSGSCLVGADLTGAELGPSVNLRRAVFCNTRMPDGSIDDSGCDRTTECCPRLVGDCPDAIIKCGLDDGAGFCSRIVGRIGPVARCGHGLCCGPCESNDPEYWNGRCNETFPECNDFCVAGDTGAFLCWVGCIGG